MRSALLAACHQLPVKSYSAGERLLWPGAESRGMVILNSGRLEVSVGKEVLGTEDRPGTVFGEVSAILGTKPMATVLALDPSECYVVTDIPEFLTRPEVARALTTLLARRLKEAGDRIRPYS